jgi:hypothetical protein
VNEQGMQQGGSPFGDIFGDFFGGGYVNFIILKWHVDYQFNWFYI